ncbi:MAG: prolyl-tRNA editing enzyme YbaK/EbsC (Cys-tRNA(Pro) deacylase) [Gammaproteobacteria bacterium]|jgi:prolyl-tRNA editing enzyme YbaK/EbsC (Cys-tRNA(Pro) deacylase)
MSTSLDRVMAALTAAKLGTIAIEMPPETHTAAQAAEAVGCDLDQIAKSMIFAGQNSGELYLFIVAGGNIVDPVKAATLVGEPLIRAHPGVVRERTGFAIAGFAPVGHLQAVRTFFDSRLKDFGIVYAAAGTPRHTFAIAPSDLQSISLSTIAELTSRMAAA